MSPGVAMTPLAENANFGTVPAGTSAVYAFNTDSARGLALAIDLLDKGVNVYRGTAGFTAAGKQFYSGAALVDGASLAASGVNLEHAGPEAQHPGVGAVELPGPAQAAREAEDRPVHGLGDDSVEPAVHHRARTSTARPATARVSGGGGTFCEALHSLAVKNEIPLSTLIPVTSADITAGNLVSQGFTALINPNGSMATTTTTGTPPVTTLTPLGTNLLAFINGGGNYVGANANGVNAARTIGATTLNTISTTGLGLITPGSTFDGTYDATNPVAWGFDLGGWIYRDSLGQPGVRHRHARQRHVGRDLRQHAGREVRLRVATRALLTARPAVVDVPYGSGRSVLIGFNPFYRSWKEQDERLVLNAALYPKGATIGAPAPSAASAEPAPTAKRGRGRRGPGREGRAADDGARRGACRVQGRP